MTEKEMRCLFWHNLAEWFQAKPDVTWFTHHYDREKCITRKDYEFAIVENKIESRRYTDTNKYDVIPFYSICSADVCILNYFLVREAMSDRRFKVSKYVGKRIDKETAKNGTAVGK